MNVTSTIEFSSFLSIFSVKVEDDRRIYLENSYNVTIPSPVEIQLKTNNYIYFYTGVVLSIFVIGLSRAFVFYGSCMRSSEKLHNNAFSAVLRTSLHFFDTNPSGRILNRFSKDTTAMDEHLPKAMLDSAQTLLAISGALILTCTVNPIFLIPATLIGTVCWWIRKVYLKTSKNIKRLEGISESL